MPSVRKLGPGHALLAFLALNLMIIFSDSLITVSAQFRNINQAQSRIRERMIREQAGSSPSVRFNNDDSFESVSNNETRVTGTGTYYRDRYDNGRAFRYNAIFDVRNGDLRDLNYSFAGGGGGGSSGGQTIYCASNDGRRNTCNIDTRGGVRLVRQRSGSPCIENQTWGYRRDYIWVDRGCRADFEISSSGGGGGSGGGSGNLPEGRVIYNGPITNEASRKALDVVDRSTQDGANVQQWSYANQPNQNWQVIDLGRSEVAIIAQHSGKALTVQGGRDNDGANIIQRSWRDNPQQRWRLDRVGGGWYRIVNADNGKCLDVTGQGMQDGANVQQWSCVSYGGQKNQKWRLGR